jgi:hypothetical protein
MQHARRSGGVARGTRVRRPRACLRALAEHLAARRQRKADPDEPTGYLTHHLAFGADAWAFTDALFTATRHHPAARWIAAEEAFSGGRSA